MQKKRLMILSLAVLLIFLLTLLPLLRLAFYNHPATDDYAYSFPAHQALIKGKGFFGALRAAADKAAETWRTWQGSFAACFLMALQPELWGDGCYFITTFVLMAVLFLGVWRLVNAFVCRICNGSRLTALLLSAAVLFMMVQFCPDVNEAFFWWNGGVYYTFFMGLALLMGAGIIRMVRSGRFHVWLCIACSLLGILIGGGNYSTALGMSFLLVCLCVWLLIRRRGAAISVIVVTVLLLAAFAVNALAPGNAVRAAEQTGLSAPMAVLQSCKNALFRMMSWTKLPQIAFFLAALPVLYVLAGKSRLSFRLPLLVVGVSFCFYASQMTPPLFAMSHIGSGRQIDIYYFGYYLLVLFQLFYLMGWMRKKHWDKHFSFTEDDFLRHILPIVCAAVLLMACGLYHVDAALRTEPAGLVALRALRSGQAQKHDAEYRESLAILQTPGRICTIRDVEDRCPYLNTFDLQKEGSDIAWINQALARYYHHKEVKLEE